MYQICPGNFVPKYNLIVKLHKNNNQLKWMDYKFL